MASRQIIAQRREETSPSSSSLADLTREVLVRDPGLSALWLDFEAEMERIPQMQTLHDPMLMTKYFEELMSGRRKREVMIGLQQQFPWFGTLDLRGQVAWRMAQEMFQKYLTRVLETAREVEGLWWDLAFQESVRAIALEEKELLEDFSRIASSMYSTGKGSQQDVLRAELEISRVDERLLQIEKWIQVLKVRLNVLRDRPHDTPLEVPRLPEALDSVQPFDPDILTEVAGQYRPELMELSHRIDRYETQRRLARNQYYPNFSLGIEGMSPISHPPVMPSEKKSQGAYSVTLGMTLPIWHNAYRAAVRQAEREIESAENQLKEMRNRIVGDIWTAHYSILETLDLMELYRDVLIPRAEQTLKSALSDFSTGQGSFLDLIDAERVLLRLRQAHEQAHRDYLLALADLDRAVGIAIMDFQGNGNWENN